jgi:hypothetical protein
VNSTLARIIVQRRKLELFASRKTNPITQEPEIVGPPLHPIQTVRVMRGCVPLVEAALLNPALSVNTTQNRRRTPRNGTLLGAILPSEARNDIESIGDFIYTQDDFPPAAALQDWDTLVNRLVHLAHDPNWRARPSVLDRLQGLVASPGRKRGSKRK